MAVACSLSKTGSKGSRTTTTWTSTYYVHADITGTFTTSNGVPGYNLTLKRYTTITAAGTDGVSFTCNWGGATATYVSTGTYHSVTTNLGFYAEGSTYTIPAMSANLKINSSSGTASTLGATTFTVPTNTYTISYNVNGGTGTISSQTGSYGNTITLSTTAPTRTNYKFIGWSTSSTATTATYSSGDTITVTNNITLYAVWKLNADDTKDISYVPHAQFKEYGSLLKNYLNTELCYTKLYQNNSGSSSTITLSDSVFNYDYVDIYFGKENRYSSQRIYIIGSSAIKANLPLTFVTANSNGIMQFSTSTVTLNAKSVTWNVNCSYFNISYSTSGGASGSTKATSYNRNSGTILIYAIYGGKYL